MQTIYRKCRCGETAHDKRYVLPARREALGVSGQFVFACRNCGALAKTRTGEVKSIGEG